MFFYYDYDYFFQNFTLKMIDLLFINGRQQGSISIMWSASLRTEIKLVLGFCWFKNTIIHPIPLQYTDTQSQIHTHTWLLVLTRIVECRFLSSQRKLDTNTHTHTQHPVAAFPLQHNYFDEHFLYCCSCRDTFLQHNHLLKSFLSLYQQFMYTLFYICHVWRVMSHKNLIKASMRLNQQDSHD